MILTGASWIYCMFNCFSHRFKNRQSWQQHYCQCHILKLMFMLPNCSKAKGMTKNLVIDVYKPKLNTILFPLYQGRANLIDWTGGPQWALKFDRGAFEFVKGICRKHLWIYCCLKMYKIIGYNKISVFEASWHLSFYWKWMKKNYFVSDWLLV